MGCRSLTRIETLCLSLREVVIQNRRPSLALLVVFALASVTSLGQTAHEQKNPIAVELSILMASLHKGNGGLLVQAHITNISQENQTIIVWTQTGWSWLSDNPLIHPATDAKQNVPWKQLLKPGEVFTENVILYLYPRSPMPVTFRLGFFRAAQFPISDQPNSIPRDQIVWSNAVTPRRSSISPGMTNWPKPSCSAAESVFHLFS